MGVNDPQLLRAYNILIKPYVLMNSSVMEEANTGKKSFFCKIELDYSMNKVLNYKTFVEALRMDGGYNSATSTQKKD